MPPMQKFTSTRIDSIQHPAIITNNAVDEDIKLIEKLFAAGEFKTLGLTSRGVEVHQTKDKRHYFAMSFTEPNMVHYFNSVKRMNIPTIGSKVIVQSLVWKSKSADKYHCHGLPAEVMTRFMLFTEHQLGSDIMQTPEGKYFWTSLVSDVLESAEPDLFVYLYDKRYSAPNLLRLTYRDDLDSLHIWGSEDEMRKVRLIVSKTELKIQ